MSVEIVYSTDGIVTARVTGELTHSELAAFQKTAAEYIEKHGPVRFLVIAEDFQGWEKTGDWGEVSFSAKYDPFIKKMAIVGEKKWEGLALIFAAQGVRRFPIEYFQPADLERARAWLTAL